MRERIIPIVALLGLTIAGAVPAMAADEMKVGDIPPNAIIIDAPDVRKIPENVIGPRFSSLLGESVYSNTGKEIGEIEDFVMARGGEMYAVIDTKKGPLAELAEIVDDEEAIVIVSLRELRRTAAPNASSTRSSSSP